MIRLGVIGMSEGNGHPFSFSAIINGFDDAAFARTGWPVIHRYLKEQPRSAFGFPDARVTCAWTQDGDATQRLCDACKIDRPVASPDDMRDRVDAVIIARDDWESHLPLARPFLERGIPVFLDKPLTLSDEELRYFAPHLASGKLFSSAGLRYAVELDPFRAGALALGQIRLIQTTVVNDLARYGIHMIEAVASLGLGPPTRIFRRDAAHEAFSLCLGDGTRMELDCLGDVPIVFQVGLYGADGHARVDLRDNFSAFRRMLSAFLDMTRRGEPTIDPDETVRVLETIMAGRLLPVGSSCALG